MAFPVVVMERDSFAQWLDTQRRLALEPEEPLAEEGLASFLANGCSACHTIRGTAADGVIGPDLTHVGGRVTIGAGTLPSDEEAFARWIAHTTTVKPGATMPRFDMLPPRELRSIAAYLVSLR
jgi:cytochrome c oxidase subunit 2